RSKQVLVAAWIPAQRSSRVDPTQALRCQRIRRVGVLKFSVSFRFARDTSLSFGWRLVRTYHHDLARKRRIVDECRRQKLTLAQVGKGLDTSCLSSERRKLKAQEGTEAGLDACSQAELLKRLKKLGS